MNTEESKLFQTSVIWTPKFQ